MSNGALFDSPVLGSVAQNIVALLIYDSERAELSGIDSERINKICKESLGKAAEGVIRSDLTIQRMLAKLRHKRVAHIMDDLRLHGVPISDDYFTHNFAQVISTRNARKIAPVFIETFFRRLRNSRRLSRNIIINFADVLEQGYWQLDNDAWEELNQIIDSVKPGEKTDTPSVSVPEPVHEQAADVKPVEVPEPSKVAEPEESRPEVAVAAEPTAEIEEISPALDLQSFEIEFDEAGEEDMMRKANALVESAVEEDRVEIDEPAREPENGQLNDDAATNEPDGALEDALDLSPEDIVAPDIYANRNGNDFENNLHDLSFAELENAEEELYANENAEVAESGDSEDAESGTPDAGELDKDLLNDLENIDFEDAEEWQVAGDFTAASIDDQQVEDDLVAGLRKLVGEESEAEDMSNQLLSDEEDELLFKELNQAEAPVESESEEDPEMDVDDLDLEDEQLLDLDFETFNDENAGDQQGVVDETAAASNTPEGETEAGEPEDIAEALTDEELDNLQIPDIFGEDFEAAVAEAQEIEEDATEEASYGAVEVDEDMEAAWSDDESDEEALVELDELVADANELEEVVQDALPEIVEAESETELEPEAQEDDPEIVSDDSEVIADGTDVAEIAEDEPKLAEPDAESGQTVEEPSDPEAPIEVVPEPIDFVDSPEEVFDEDVEIEVIEASDVLLADIDDEPMDFEENLVEMPDEIVKEEEVAADADDIDHSDGSTADDIPGTQAVDFWHERNLIMPVRGLRNLELGLRDKPLLFLAGQAGCGKSTFVSGYLSGLTQTGALDSSRVFYYRFPKGETDAEAFLISLNRFFQQHNIEYSGADTYERWATLLIHSDGYFVFDDLHNVHEQSLLDIFNDISEKVEIASNFSGKVIMIGRETLEDLILPSRYNYSYEGLTTAESNSLLRDKWQLHIPRDLRRLLAAKLLGNPRLMKLFRDWWKNESRTDTELERFVENMPLGANDIFQYISGHIYESFERVDSRLNAFMKAVCLFRIPETEDFLERAYDKIGAGDFQGLLERLVEDHGLLEFSDQSNRYEVPDLVREFYSQKLHSSDIKRILHLMAGQLYSKRFADRQELMDAVEGAYHFLDAERGESAARLLLPITPSNHDDELLAGQVLDILSELTIASFGEPALKAHSLYNRGKLYLEAGIMDQAEADLRACRRLQLPDELKGAVSFALGEIAQANDQRERAVDLYRDSLLFFEKFQDEDNIAAAANMLGNLYLDMGEHKQATDMLEKAMAGYKSEVADQESLVETCSNLGIIHKNKEDYDVALDYFRKALNAARDTETDFVIADLLGHIGDILTKRSEWQAAIDTYEEALGLARKQRDHATSARLSENLGNIHLFMRKAREALNCYEKARESYSQANDNEGLASIYNRIGGVHQSRNEWDKALDCFRKSSTLYSELEHQEGMITSLCSLGAVFMAGNHMDEAFRHYERALTLRRESGNRSGVADILERTGHILHEKAQLGEAMDRYEQALALREALGDSAGSGHIFVHMGNVYRSDGQLEDAVKLYQKALHIFENSKNAHGLAGVYQSLGAVYQEMGELDPAAGAYSNAIEMFDRLNNSMGLVKSLYALGNICHDSGYWEEALKHYAEALPIFEDMGDLAGMAQTIGNISSIEFEQEQHKSAIARQVQILLYFQDSEKSELVEKVLANLVACHQDLGADRFQPILTDCLERTATHGVDWGRHKVIGPEKAEIMIKQIFYNG